MSNRRYGFHSGVANAKAVEIGTSSANMILSKYNNSLINVQVTSSSINTSNSVRPIYMVHTMNGVGGVGGRAEFKLVSNVALGSWCNALKGYTSLGATGTSSGLASSICAEMDVAYAGSMPSGQYYPLEIELIPGATTATSGTSGNSIGFMFMSVNTNTADFLSNGMIMSLNGLGTATSNKVFQPNTATAASHALRIMIGGVKYYIMLTENGA